jgi:hypothetical protein
MLLLLPITAHVTSVSTFFLLEKWYKQLHDLLVPHCTRMQQIGHVELLMQTAGIVLLNELRGQIDEPYTAITTPILIGQQ